MPHSDAAPSTSFPNLLTYKQVSELLHVPMGTVRYWIATRKLQAYKPGMHPLVRESDLLAFVESRPVGQVFEREHVRRTRAGVGTFAATRGVALRGAAATRKAKADLNGGAK